MGLERLYDAEVSSLPTDGQSGRTDVQLVAPVRPSLRREASSGGDHQSASLVERSGRLAVHQNQRKVRVSLQHENSQELAQAIAHVSNTLQRFWPIAEHRSVEQRWSLLLTHIFRHWLGGKWLGMLPPEAESLLSG
jgi:hypothetical protein